MSSGRTDHFKQYKWYTDNVKGSTPIENSAYVNEYEVWTFNLRNPKPSLRPLPWTNGQVTRLKFDLTEYTSVNPQTGSRIRGPSIVQLAPNPLKIERNSGAGDASAAYYKARAKMGSGPVNLAENIGDFHKTADMVAKRIRQLGEAARQLKNGNVKGLYQALKMDGQPSRREEQRVRDTPFVKRLADHWLEYTYGWKPLVQDIWEALEALRRRSIDPVGKVKRYSHTNYYPRRAGSGKDLPKKRARGYVSGRVRNPGVHLLNGLGLLNPALLWWELLPYSFVVDWFLPIGDILTSLTAGLGMDGVVGGLVYEDETIETYGGRPWKTTQDIWRVPVNGLPIFLPFRSASFEQSWQHVVSAASLLAQRFR